MNKGEANKVVKAAEKAGMTVLGIRHVDNGSYGVEVEGRSVGFPTILWTPEQLDELIEERKRHAEYIAALSEIDEQD